MVKSHGDCTLPKLAVVGIVAATFFVLRSKKQKKSKSIENIKDQVNTLPAKIKESCGRKYPSFKKKPWLHTTLAAKIKSVGEIELEEKSFLSVLESLIGYTEFLQNRPPELIPREDLAAFTVMDYLEPYSQKCGGPLELRKINYTEGRSHVIIRYAAAEKTDKIISFVGSHMDVVPANPDEWKRNPFKLQKEDNYLYGRGTTDCLGHVAMFCNFFKQLAQLKPNLKINVACVFICDEESGKDPTVGITELEKRGELESLKHGPLIWVDSANFGPTMGTAGMQQWKLEVTGKKFHSGLPNQGINPINLGFDAMKYIQTEFYKDFPMTAQAKDDYKFICGSSLKPTQIKVPPGSINQIPGSCTIEGDIRITPFYEVDTVKKKVMGYVSDFRKNVMMGAHIKGGHGRYELKEENIQGKVEWIWVGESYLGIACTKKSIGYKSLYNAIEKVRGKAEPFSLTGSLPVIRGLQNSGFDVQITGFGKHEAYHAVDEFGLLSDFKDGCKIIANVVADLNENL